MRRETVLITLMLLSGNLLWQPLLSQNVEKWGWDILSDVSFSPKLIEEYGERYLVPEFGQKPRQHEGKPFLITGYIIPIDPQNDIYILSQNPFASCFFCGNAGPETIVELIFDKNSKSRRKTYRMDDIRTFTGILRLNADDIEHTNYILEQAEEMQ